MAKKRIKKKQTSQKEDKEIISKNLFFKLVLSLIPVTISCIIFSYEPSWSGFIKLMNSNIIVFAVFFLSNDELMVAVQNKKRFRTIINYECIFLVSSAFTFFITRLLGNSIVNDNNRVLEQLGYFGFIGVHLQMIINFMLKFVLINMPIIIVFIPIILLINIVIAHYILSSKKLHAYYDEYFGGAKKQ